LAVLVAWELLIEFILAVALVIRVEKEPLAVSKVVVLVETLPLADEPDIAVLVADAKSATATVPSFIKSLVILVNDIIVLFPYKYYFSNSSIFC
tara:strand:+ start:595 stop:876 length:282 start_codon:yes stop_codon:yes gene_type:complete